MSDKLDLILTELRSLREEVHRYRTLGFSNGVPAWRQRLYVGQPDGDEGATALYSWNSLAKQAVPIPYEFLTGYITGLKLDDSKTYRGKPNVKLLIQVDADSKYEISSGVKNLFSRSFIWAIYNTPLDKFKKPVVLQFRPKPDSETEEYAGSVWCNVTQGKERLNSDYPKKGSRSDQELNSFWEQIFNKAMAKFNKLDSPESDIPSTAPSAPSGQRPLIETKALANDPQRNLKRFRAIVKTLGLAGKVGDQLIKQAISDRYPERKSCDLLEPEVNSVRDSIFIAYGSNQLPSQYRTLVAGQYLQMYGALGDEDCPADDEAIAMTWLEVLAGLIANINQRNDISKKNSDVDLASVL